MVLKSGGEVTPERAIQPGLSLGAGEVAGLPGRPWRRSPSCPDYGDVSRAQQGCLVYGQVSCSLRLSGSLRRQTSRLCETASIRPCKRGRIDLLYHRRATPTFFLAGLLGLFRMLGAGQHHPDRTDVIVGQIPDSGTPPTLICHCSRSLPPYERIAKDPLI